MANDEICRLEQFGSENKGQKDSEEQRLTAAADALRDIRRVEKTVMPEVIMEVRTLLGNGDFIEGLRHDPPVVVAGRLLHAEDAEDGPKLLSPAPERKPPKKRPRRRETATERKQKQMTRIRHHALRSKQSFSRR